MWAGVWSSLMYLLTASLFQRPRSLMLCLEMPLASAVAVAPFRREWPQKPIVQMPALRSNSRILSSRYCFGNGKPCRQEKRGACREDGKRVNSFSRAVTGHNRELREAAR